MRTDINQQGRKWAGTINRHVFCQVGSHFHVKLDYKHGGIYKTLQLRNAISVVGVPVIDRDTDMRD